MYCFSLRYCSFSWLEGSMSSCCSSNEGIGLSISSAFKFQFQNYYLWGNKIGSLKKLPIYHHGQSWLFSSSDHKEMWEAQLHRKQARMSTRHCSVILVWFFLLSSVLLHCVVGFFFLFFPFFAVQLLIVVVVVDVYIYSCIYLFFNSVIFLNST